MKKIIPALALLLVSAVLLSTASFAWFSMNTTVSATNMQVQATAEDGIAIAAFVSNTTMPDANSTDFANTDATNAAAMTNMHPTITADAATWYHAASTQSANGQAYDNKTGYSTVTNVAAVVGVDANDDGDYDDVGDTAPVEAVNYYQVNKFAIKSTGTTAQAVYVKSISVKVGDDPAAQAYSNALRILVKSGDATLIYAPLGSRSGDTFTETLLASTATASTTTSGSDDAVTADIEITIKNPTQYNKLASKILNDVGATPEEVDIYIFFDGEDAACKSDNIPTTAFETLTVEVTFTSETPNS